MITRRDALTGAAALAVAAPAAAQAPTARRPNPMPDSLRAALERDPTAPVLGNPLGSITLSEFLDYNCPHCRAMVPLLPQLIAADADLRIVLREWPVFGEGSDFAARAALAALAQGRYWPVHTGLMTMRGRAEEASVLRVLRRAGVDEARLRRDMDGAPVLDHIDASARLADHMGLVGTPSFVCGDAAAFGRQTLADLQALVAAGRAALG